MSRSPHPYPWLHTLAWLTAVVALLPIGIGAVVTTLDAGMAFADWPTSDGQGMFAYPWLKSTGDHFWEHGHRLAGMAIGFLSLILVGVAFGTECRAEIRLTTVGIVVAVIAQGLLGGARVVADKRMLALLHGDFAAAVYCLIGILVAMTGRKWFVDRPSISAARGWTLFVLGSITLVLLSVQYVFGGLLRHLGSSLAWLVHPWLAIAVVVAALAFAIAAWRSGSSLLARHGSIVLGLLIAQALLGVVTWAVKFGYPQFGIVAMPVSWTPVAIRSLHMVLGLVTLMTVVVALVRVRQALPTRAYQPTSAPAALPASGGLA